MHTRATIEAMSGGHAHKQRRRRKRHKTSVLGQGTDHAQTAIKVVDGWMDLSFSGIQMHTSRGGDVNRHKTSALGQGGAADHAHTGDDRSSVRRSRARR